MDEGALLSIPNPTSTAVRERGEAAAINAMTGTVNTAANPLKIGGYIPLYATGEGQTVPADQDGRLGGATPNNPVLPVSVTVDGNTGSGSICGGARTLWTAIR
jgi:uncharacterized protein (TIGR03437 family)